MVLPKGISMESLTTVVGITVQKPTRSTAAVTKTDGIQAFVRFETASPMKYTTPQITNASAKLYIVFLLSSLLT